MALKGLAVFGDVHPEATLSANGARSLDDEPENISALRGRGQVNESSGHIGRSIILQRKQVDLARGAHCDGSTTIPGLDQRRRESTGESGTIHLTSTAIVNGIEKLRNYLRKRKKQKRKERKSRGREDLAFPSSRSWRTPRTAGQMTSCIFLGICVTFPFLPLEYISI